MVDTNKLLDGLELLFDAAIGFCRNSDTLTTENEIIEAENNLRGLILAQEQESEIQVVYEYKLSPRPPDESILRMYFNAGLKKVSKNGKSWRAQGHLNIAITTWINDVYLESIKPDVYQTDTSGKTLKPYTYTQEWLDYTTMRDKSRKDKEFRAMFIPETWTVVAIAVNTKSDIRYINAREFYLKGMIKQ